MRLVRPHRRFVPTSRDVHCPVTVARAVVRRSENRVPASGGPAADGAGSLASDGAEPAAASSPLLWFEFDRLGYCTSCAATGMPLIGLTPARTVGRSIFELYAHLPEVIRAVRGALNGTGSSHTVAQHGQALLMAYLPRADGAGLVDGVTCIACDVSELHAGLRELQRSEQRLRATEGRFRSLVTNMRDIIFSHGSEGEGAYGYDEAGPMIYGADAHKLAGTVDEHGRPRLETWYAAVHPDDRAAYLAAEWRRKVLRENYTLEYRIHHPVTGEMRWMREVAWVVTDDAQQACFDSYIIDITEPKRVEIALTESRERYRSLVESAPVAIMIVDGVRCTYANPQAVRLLGGACADDIQGRGIEDFVEVAEASRLAAAFAGLAIGSRMPAHELHCRRCDGALTPVEVSAVAVAEHGQPRVHVVLLDLAERKRAEALHHMARHDVLTGLPNRGLLMERLRHGIAQARRGADRFALMLLDVDRFKEINDGFGHVVGDELLRQVAHRVRQVIREADTLARLGGDEFALLQVRTADPASMTRVAERVTTALAAPFVIGSQEIHASVSIGITSCPQDAHDVEDLLRRADLALYRAKAQGRGRYCFFEASLDAAMASRRQLEIELNRAILQGELHLVYQPELDVATRRIVGAEALLRWNSAVRGPVPPGEFIPVAEATGLMRALTAWVLDRACAQASTWRREGLELPVTVNVAPMELRRSELAVEVASILNRHDLPGAQLCLELADSVLTDPRLGGLGEALEALAATGVRLAIDGFGLGPASLVELRRLPVHRLKIDRTLVGRLCSDPDRAAVVRAAIALGHSLGKRMLASGVETEAQHERLAALGCDGAQGYLYAEPMPAELLRSRLMTPARPQR